MTSSSSGLSGSSPGLLGEACQSLYSEHLLTCTDMLCFESAKS